MADLFGKKWLHQVLKELYLSKNLRYSELKRHIPQVSPKTLSERLRMLESLGLIKREVYTSVPIKVEYTLTKRGAELAYIVVESCEWVHKWYTPTNSTE